MTDLTGKRFGKLTVLGPTDRRAHGALVWACRCDCGALVERRTDYLTGGTATSCGCDNQKKREDLTGRRFGWLTVLGPGEHSRGRFTWRCRCDCGAVVDKRTDDLKSRLDISCGCKNKRRKEDLTGQRFGRLTVLGPTRRRSSGSIVWECRCDCGNVVEKPGKHLKDGTVKSCGCLSQGLDLTGERFGRLVALEPTDKRRKSSVIWRCLCDCGNEVDCESENLTRGRVRSCGCLQTEQRKKNMASAIHFVDGTCVEKIACQRLISTNTSGHRGVSRRKNGTWRACLDFQGKRYDLGTYRSFHEAVEARLKGEEIYHEFLSKYYSGNQLESLADAKQRGQADAARNEKQALKIAETRNG